MVRKFEISEKTIIFAVLFPLALYFLWIVRELLFSLLIAFILMSALKPLAEYLTRYKIPRVPAVFIVFITFVVFFVSLFFLIIPPIITETTILVKNFPSIVQSINPELRQYVDLSSLSQVIPSVTNNIFSILGSLFSNLLFVVTTLFFTVYFMLERDLVRRVLHPYMKKQEVEHYARIIESAEKKFTSWFWGQLSLMTLVGLMTYIGLNLIGVRYSLPLAVLAGLLEVVPNIGPIIASVPAVLIGLSDNNFVGFSTLALYFIIQQLENALIVPLIMKRAVGYSPIITLIALIIGGKIGGVIGVLLSIPLLILAETIISELLRVNKKPVETAEKEQ